VIPLLPLAGLLKSRWTWYALGGLALIVGALWVRHHYIEVGKEQGREEQKQSDQQEIEQQRQVAKAEAQQKIAEANAKAAEADGRATRAEADAALYAARAQALAGQLVSSRTHVASIPPGQLHATALAEVQQHPMANQSPDPERAIVERVFAAPLLAAQNRELRGQIGELGKEVAALRDQVSALEERDRARVEYERRLEQAYVQLYNLHPPRKRGWKCLRIWRCADNKLPVPGLEALKKGATP